MQFVYVWRRRDEVNNAVVLLWKANTVSDKVETTVPKIKSDSNILCLFKLINSWRNAVPHKFSGFILEKIILAAAATQIIIPAWIIIPCLGAWSLDLLVRLSTKLRIAIQW